MQGKQEILEHIHTFVREYQKERELTARWKQPLMGFADANSPYIRSLKELISPTHYLPEEFLPDCKTILCYFFPFTEEIARSNEEGEEPSAGWVRALSGDQSDVCRAEPVSGRAFCLLGIPGSIAGSGGDDR